MRRKLQKIATARILFLDETALRLSAAPTHTVVLPGEQPYVLATDTSSYAARYDMIAVCTGVVLRVDSGDERLSVLNTLTVSVED
jgi:hypothetical protein